MSIKTGIIGASGYTGLELLRLLSGNTNYSIKIATGHSQTDISVNTLFPSLNYRELQLSSFEKSLGSMEDLDLIFLALPHGESGPIANKLNGNYTIIDLSSDHRFNNNKSNQTWSYGLPELFRSGIKASNRIANPGCYPTAVSLAVAPLAKSLRGPIAAVCMSGSSGAGKTPSSNLHFSNLTGSVQAYKITNHPHTFEIESCLSLVANKQITASFTPHLVPMTRGIHATVILDLDLTLSQQNLNECFSEFYQNEPFVTISSEAPLTKYVTGTNRCIVYPVLDSRLNKVVVTSVIDNLVKGASGQAIQNSNLVFGLPEDSGLPTCGLYP